MSLTLGSRSVRLLGIIADHFLTHFEWPDATDLQRQLVRADGTDDLIVWDEVAVLPKGLLRREPTGDGRELLVLTANGLSLSGRAVEQLELFIKLVRYFVKAWKDGVEDVPQSDFAKILAVSPDVANLVAMILRTEGLVAYPQHSGEEGPVWRPAKHSVFQFRNITDVEGYLLTVDRIMGHAPLSTHEDRPPKEVNLSDVLELEAAVKDDAKRGFLLMPFRDELGWLHLAVRKAAALEGTLVTRADDISSPGVVLEQIFDAIDNSDVVISACTGRNPNVFFEMGYAWRDHKVILVAEHSGDLSFDVHHYRTVLYQGEDASSLEDKLRRAIRSVLSEDRLPRGRRLSAPPPIKKVARLSGRLEQHGKNHRLVITNSGTVPVNDVDIEVPPEAQSFHVISEDLPLKTIRPGVSIPIPAITVMGGGPGIFDIRLRGTTENGEVVEEPVTISLY